MTYKGKFYPQLAKSLINISAVPLGSTVLDPFCGSGTTILEAFLNGMAGVGCDMHPLATKIARAKVEILAIEPARCEQAILQVLDRVTSPKRTILQDTGQFRAEILGELFMETASGWSKTVASLPEEAVLRVWPR